MANEQGKLLRLAQKIADADGFAAVLPYHKYLVSRILFSLHLLMIRRF